MIEVEIKVKIKDITVVKHQLNELGFIECSNMIEEDLYFDNVEQRIRKNGQALRIRTVTNLNTNEKQTMVTFKGKKLDDVSMTRQELETIVSDEQVCLCILKELGYEPVKPFVKKRRMELKWGQMTACLDFVENLGEFLELEHVILETESKEIALSEIENVLKQLGYSLADTTRTSYLSQLQGMED